MGAYLNTVSSASKVVVAVPMKLTKAGSSHLGERNSSFKGFESQTTEAGTNMMATISTTLRKTSGSDGLRKTTSGSDGAGS